MQNSQVFLVEFGKHCVQVRNNGCFRDLRAIGVTHGWPETGFFRRILVTHRKNGKNPVSLVLMRRF
ncbi:MULTISPECIES: hypothetical protein [unclassified Microcoleus]|uniref:hypothetical protein n=1 Tax=unclassified Microcoleus TaxID=2642155 RepID=UPI002FD5F132